MSGQVPKAVQKERAKQLRDLFEQKTLQFETSFIGSTRQVLWESTQHLSPSKLEGVPDGRGRISYMFGWTDNYIRLSRPYSPTLAGSIEEVEIRPENIVRE